MRLLKSEHMTAMTLLSLLLVVIVALLSHFAAPLVDECEVLRVVFHSMNGPETWHFQRGWSESPSASSCCLWHGVTCDAPGQHVTSLELDGNGLRGPVPQEIGSLSRLRLLDLSSNEITEVPSSLANLKELRMLLLCFNNISAVHDEWGTLERLEHMLIMGNQIERLPAAWATLHRLTILFAENNRIRELPEEWGDSMLELLSVDVAHNKIERLPPRWSNLGSIVTFRGDDNQVTELPAEWSKMVNLRNLQMSNNLLTSLPREFSTMTKLSSVLVNGNKQLATIPDEWAAIPSLSLIGLEGCGVREVPEAFRAVMQATMSPDGGSVLVMGRLWKA